MFFRNVLSALLLLTLFQNAFAQTADKENPKARMDELRREAVVFLRETSAEVGALRTLENRISFSAELAGLMWFYDEKEAAAMYGTVITDFKQLLADYDAQLNALGGVPVDSEYSGGLYAGGEQDKKVTFVRKFQKAMGVRQQVAMNLAEHDATLAVNFYFDTLSIITNPELRKSIEDRDSYFETQFIRTVAQKDAAKALEIARKSLESKGVDWSNVELLQKIYEKDAAKGAEYADAIVNKLKSDKASGSNFYNVRSFLSMGAENFEKIKKEGGKKPMFSEQNLRDLAEILAQSVLQQKDADEVLNGPYIYLIEKYAPSRALQIRAQFPDKVKRQTATVISNGDEPRVMVKSAPTPAPLRNSTAEVEALQESRNQARKEQEETMKNVMKLKELPKEEREKTVARARKIINGLGKKQEKMMALSMLASQVAAAGDKELAAEVMKDAQALVNPSPKNYQDFLEIWFLASAYAASDADKAFPLLEDTIFRLNDTISAFVKVGEFMDISGEVLDDGEVQVGSFGGAMMTSLTRELGIANLTIRNLALADFGKTKALTNKFDRPEVRILAKMLVLRAILGDETKKSATSATTETDEV
ncbi:MAG TPA: hypothetical protein VGC97_14375 [Pyrinomonadaceae bacterium]|jgi:hypothetical protein